MYWVVFTVALGGVLARDGESCVSQNCWETNSCQKSVKVGAKCSNGAFSGRCGKGIEDSNVDCDKSVGGQPCCVYSRFEGSCECVQRRCHTSKFPDKRVPEECLKERATASTPWWAIVVALAIVVLLGVGIFLCLRKRNRSLRQNSRIEEEEEGKRKTKDVEQTYSLVEEK